MYKLMGFLIRIYKNKNKNIQLVVVTVLKLVFTI